MDRNKKFTMNSAVQMSSSNRLIKCSNKFTQCLLYTFDNVYNGNGSKELPGIF